MAAGPIEQTGATWNSWASGKGLESPDVMAGAERAALTSRGGSRHIKAKGWQGQGKSQESLEIPDIVRPAIALTGHLPAAEVSEVIGRGWDREEKEEEEEEASLLPDML